jgi:hypothetical protein
METITPEVKKWQQDRNNKKATIIAAIEGMGILRDYSGWLVHDFWPAYFKLLCKHAVCWHS